MNPADDDRGHAAETRLLDEWPGSIGAMVALSLMRFDGNSSDPDATGSDRVFQPISVENLKILECQDISAAKIAAFVGSQFRFSERFFGSFDGPEGHVEFNRQLAVLSLVYLGRDEKVVSGLIAAFTPLLRLGLWDVAFRDRISRTFADDAFHYIYDVQGMAGSGDHEPFDWMGNLNQFSASRRREWLDFAEMPPLRRPGFPPQRVWLAHTNLQPFPSDAAYRRALLSLYAGKG